MCTSRSPVRITQMLLIDPTRGACLHGCRKHAHIPNSQKPSAMKKIHWKTSLIVRASGQSVVLKFSRRSQGLMQQDDEHRPGDVYSFFAPQLPQPIMHRWWGCSRQRLRGVVPPRGRWSACAPHRRRACLPQSAPPRAPRQPAGAWG